MGGSARDAPPLEAALARMAAAAAGADRLRFERGAMLYAQDEPALAGYYILRGNVRLYLLAADGRERTLAILPSGELAGDASLYLQDRYEHCAEAFGATVDAYRIGPEGFRRLLDGWPEMSAELLRRLARYNRLLSREIGIQSFQGVRERVQVALITLAGQYGRPGPDGIVIQLHVTHETLASLVGANRATVSSCLGRLREEGFCRTANHRLVLADWAAGLVLPP